MHTYQPEICSSTIQGLAQSGLVVLHPDTLPPFFSTDNRTPIESPIEPLAQRIKELIVNNVVYPDTTFFVRVNNHSLVGLGIHDQDILIVDQSLKPDHKNTVIAQLNNEFLIGSFIKRRKGHGQFLWNTGNLDYPLLHLHENQGMNIWGVVILTIHTL